MHLARVCLWDSGVVMPLYKLSMKPMTCLVWARGASLFLYVGLRHESCVS